MRFFAVVCQSSNAPNPITWVFRDASRKFNLSPDLPRPVFSQCLIGYWSLLFIVLGDLPTVPRATFCPNLESEDERKRK